MYCQKCGKEIPNDSNLCPYCGVSLKNQTENKPPKKKKGCLFGCLGFIIIIILFGVIASCSNNSSNNTSNNTTSSTNTTNSSATVSSISSVPESELGLSNILNIILIAFFYNICDFFYN